MADRLIATLLLPFLVAACLTRVAAQETPTTRDVPDFATPLITSDPPTGTEPSADSLTATETAVLATHDAMIAAVEDLAFDRLATLLISTNRGALIADGRITLSNDDTVETLRREFAPLRSVHHTFTRRHVSLLSPTTALVVAEGTIQAHTHDGAAITRPFAQTLVFMKVDDAWKIAHLHSSAPPAKLGD